MTTQKLILFAFLSFASLPLDPEKSLSILLGVLVGKSFQGFTALGCNVTLGMVANRKEVNKK